MQSGIIRFTDNAQEELALLTKELRLTNLIQALGQGSSVPEDVKDDMRQMLLVLSDMFSTDLPSIEDNPVDTLRAISRDLNASRILRERGLFRLYRMLNTDIQIIDKNPENGVEFVLGMTKIYKTLADPDTGEQFHRREDFLGWFCREAHVSRSTVFMRMASIDKLLSLGYSLEQSYGTITAAPSAVRDAINLLADWEDGELLVKPDVASRLAERFMPEARERIDELVDVLKDEEADLETQEKAHRELSQTLRPAVTQVLEEVANHQNVKDAMAMVRHDIVGKPEISYRMDYDTDQIEVEVLRKAKDPQGTEYVTEVVKFRLIPDPEMPVEVRTDLLERLPFKNRVRF